MKSSRQIFRVLLLLILVLPSGGCFFLFNYSSLILGLNVTPGGSSANIPDDLSNVEIDLYSDGPVDIPVTIAKLDSPDAEKITVEVEGGAPSENAPQLIDGEPQWQSSPLEMVITGDAGAVDFAQTPNLVAYLVDSVGVDTSSGTVTSANGDGSFQLKIPFDEQKEVIFAGITSDLLYTSTFLRVIQQTVVEDGVARKNYVIVMTNSNSISADQGVLNDGSGYYYLSTLNAGVTTFSRRNIDGTEIQVLMDDVGAPLEHLSAISESKIAYIDADATLGLIIPSTIPLTLAKPGPQEEEIASYTRTFATLTSYDPSATKLMINQDEDGIIVNQFSEDYSALNYIRTVSGASINIVQDGLFSDVKAALANAADKMYVMVLYEGEYLFYEVDLSGSIVTAWSQRTLLLEDLDFSAVHSIDADNVGGVVIDATDSLGTRALYYWTEAGGMVMISDPAVDSNDYGNIKISPDGDMVIACLLGADGAANQFAFYQPTVDAPGTLHQLTLSADNSVCTESQQSYQIVGRLLHFYRTDLGTGVPQRAIINLDTVE